MFCDESFTPSHQLKHKQTQLLVMEMDDDDYIVTKEPGLVEEIAAQPSFYEVPQLSLIPQLSLNAMTGFPIE